MLNVHLQSATGTYIVTANVSKKLSKQLKNAPFKREDVVGTLSSHVRGIVAANQLVIQCMTLTLLSQLGIREGNLLLAFDEAGGITFDELKLN